MARTLIDATPLTFDDLRSEHRSDDEHEMAAELLRRLGADPATARFRRFEVTTADLIESVIVESQAAKRIPVDVFDYRTWRRDGTDQSQLREFWSTVDSAKREASPDAKARCEQLERLYSSGAEVDPLVAKAEDLPLSSGDPLLRVLDGRHRLFAAVAAGVQTHQVFVLDPT